MLLFCSKWLLFPSPCWKHEFFFLWFSLWELIGLLEVKLTKVPSTTTSQDWGSLGVFNSQACLHLSLQEFVYYSWNFSTLVLVPVDVLAPPLLLWEATILCILLSVSPIWGALWPQSSVGSKIFDFFCCCSAFSLAVKIGGMTSKFLICHTRNWKSELLFLIASFWLL